MTHNEAMLIRDLCTKLDTGDFIFFDIEELKKNGYFIGYSMSNAEQFFTVVIMLW